MANKKVEEPEHVSSSSSESGSDDEQHDGAQQEQQDGEGSPCRSRQSRNEKKARKAVLRLGMKPMPEIVKVVIRKAKQVSAVSAPQRGHVLPRFVFPAIVLNTFSSRSAGQTISQQRKCAAESTGSCAGTPFAGGKATKCKTVEIQLSVVLRGNG